MTKVGYFCQSVAGLLFWRIVKRFSDAITLNEDETESGKYSIILVCKHFILYDNTVI